MRLAIVSDIHGNLTAFEAVVADLRETSPDLILHGGDIADSGSGPVEIVDRIRELGWQGVVGNTDEMLAMPETFEAFAGALPAMAPLWTAVREMASFTREALGEERLNWLRELPRAQVCDGVGLVHAGPGDCWRAPAADAADAELERVYEAVGQKVAVYGHIHRPYIRRPYIRRVGGLLVANSGSVGQPHDGDCRAAYLLIDDSVPSIRRVEYDVERELSALSRSGLPHAGWVGQIIRSAAPQMPAPPE